VVDVFDEVEEQLRADRYKQMALKALPWIAGALGAALIAALGIWGYDAYTTKATAKASDEYAQALDAFQAGRTDEADRLFGEVANSSSKAYKALALQQQGGIKLAAGKTAEAVKLFDASAAAAPDFVIGDAARLKSAFALLDTAPYKDMEARLEPLMKDGRPYKAQAREARAFAKILAGDYNGAKDDFVVISLMPDAQDGARARAQAAKQLIESGSAKAVAGAVKAAMALPPPVQLAPGASVPGLSPSAPQQQAQPAQ